MSRVAKAPITLPSQVSLEIGVRQVMVKRSEGVVDQSYESSGRD